MSHEIIFSMSGVGKIFPPKKQVLKNIYLSFFYGAKIGVLGLNGSGKSSLLKIIAGLDKDFIGEVAFSSGYTVGFLEQEPKLDPTKTVKEIVEEGAQEIVNLLKEYEDINNKFAEPMNDDAMTKLIERQGAVQEKLDATNAWELDNKLERAMDALRCPPPEAKLKTFQEAKKEELPYADCF
jgi:ATPase subunit of ABC transporter with duplicated ATPase domains